MKLTLATVAFSMGCLVTTPAFAQLGGLGKIADAGKKAADAKQTFDDLTFTDQEEQQIGSDISTKLRERYGVVQDPAVHKYVSLVGSVLAKDSSRPNLRWTFIVLDTDGVNAFAAPGGFVHVTRGALALIQNEAELADVMAHEISHVTQKHTIDAIKKAKRVELGSKATKSEIASAFAQKAYEAILENAYDRGDEEEADRLGITLANGAGYAPTGLKAFLSRLSDRNKGLKDRSGMFASHPETQSRLDTMTKTIASAKLTASATVAPRYTQAITYKPVAVTSVPQGAAPAASSDSKSSSGGGKLGIGNKLALGNDKDSSVSSGGSRGVNPDRDAKGGPDKGLVTVSVSAAEVATFRKGIAG